MSRTLEQRAEYESRRAARIQENLKDLKARRKRVALLSSTTTNMTPAEILYDFNKTVAALRQTAVDEVGKLRREEIKLNRAEAEAAAAFDNYQECIQARLKARQNLMLAQTAIEKAEELTDRGDDGDAKAAWEEAQKLVVESNQVLKLAVQKRVKAETTMKKSNHKLAYRKAALERLTEVVRSRKQERRLLRQKRLATPYHATFDVSPSTTHEAIAELDELACEELLMEETSNRLENMAGKLKARASELRSKAELSWAAAQDQMNEQKRELKPVREILAAKGSMSRSMSRLAP
uniref:Uncharacterized protein n=1 Tax=Entomoneis paludosa TaxID=265537 RepID=A0A7S2YIP8_9STRA|mmetsp:Transcript_34781/g.72398  ORF Transcript_34781/g.72398 Transcript_34781/m.72398 type:complete len:293 (+) Transcript_34781:1-879(+)